MSESLLAAEQQIASLIEEQHSAEALLVTPEAAQEAGEAFAALCNDEMFANAAQVRFNELIDGYPQSYLRKSQAFQDSSRMTAKLVSRTVLPASHPDNAVGLREAPKEVTIRSWAGVGESARIMRAEYTLDEATGTVSKTVQDQMEDILHMMRRSDLAQVELEAEGFDGDEDELEFAAARQAIQEAIANIEMERQFGFSEPVIVGPEEVADLRRLVLGMTPE